jgi:hypothetical protein
MSAATDSHSASQKGERILRLDSGLSAFDLRELPENETQNAIG